MVGVFELQVFSFCLNRATEFYFQNNFGQGDGRFQCETCHKNFTNNSRLKRHLLVHTKETPFICEVCNKGFSQQENMKRHMKNKHPKEYIKN